jgi:uncharacterized repeat protein (TIGR03803 family)
MIKANRLVFLVLSFAAALHCDCGAAVLTTLVSFSFSTNGFSPQAALVQGSDGNLYGTTTRNYGNYNGGTCFQLSTNGMLRTLYAFPPSEVPSGALVQRSYDGDFYGTSTGTAFRLMTNGQLAMSTSFNSDANGSGLNGLLEGLDGYLYGTASSGGAYGFGTAFKMTFNGRVTLLHSFTNWNEGANPEAEMVLGQTYYDTTYYGTTTIGGKYNAGTVFGVTANGVFATLYSFTGTYDGYFPSARLLCPGGAVGSTFYGTTQLGGTTDVQDEGAGTIFRFDFFNFTAGGGVNTLFSFNGTNGRNPHAGLILGKDGNLYGTTPAGGPIQNSNYPQGCGTIFRITTNGVFTSLYSFGAITNANGYALDGAQPQAALIQASDGNFYGTTTLGGSNNLGTVFRLSIAPGPAPVIQTPLVTNGTVILTWSAVAGQSYQVQCASNFNQAGWASLGSPIMATGATLTASDPMVPGASRRFYRVVLQP